MLSENILLKNKKIVKKINKILKLEGFYPKLNQQIEIQNPKCSLVLDMLKNKTINSFKKNIKNLTIVNNENESYSDIWITCYDYILRFHKKYHSILILKKLLK